LYRAAGSHSDFKRKYENTAMGRTWAVRSPNKEYKQGSFGDLTGMGFLRNPTDPSRSAEIQR